MQEFEERGVAVWTISPDPPEKLAKYTAKKKIGFTMLSDDNLEVTKLFGIVNRSKTDVPHPTAMVVDAKGLVRYIRIDGDYSKRPSIDELLQAVDALPPTS